MVVVDYHGTGGGLQHDTSRARSTSSTPRGEAKADEEAKAKAQGIEWTRFLVGYDGITLVVNPKNDFVKSLTVEQLKAIWEPESKVKTWKDVDPSWPDRKIILYSPDNDSGTFEFFTEAIVGKAKSQREDVQQSSDDNILVIGVAGDTDGSGYFGYAYFAANKDKLRAVAVQNGPSAPPVLPSPETIIDKTYAPLSRPLFIYVKNSAARRPEVGRVPQVSTSTRSTSSPSRAATLLRRPKTRRPIRRRSPSLLAGDDEPRPRQPRRRRRSKELGLALFDRRRPGESIGRTAGGRPLAGPFPRSWRSGKAVVTVGLVLCAAITVLTTAGIILVLGVQSFEFFRLPEVSVTEFLFGTELKPDADPPKFGILPLLWGTFVVAAGSSMIALPIGLLSAIYLSEYAPRRVRSVLKPTLELLAGIPTIVYGYLALLLVTPVLKRLLEPLGFACRDVQRPQPPASWSG